jgi:hypothetical protein
MFRLLLLARDVRSEATGVEARQTTQRDRQHIAPYRIRQSGSYPHLHPEGRNEKAIQAALHSTDYPNPCLLHGIPLRAHVSDAVYFPLAILRALRHEHRTRFTELHFHGVGIFSWDADNGTAQRCSIPPPQEAQQRRGPTRVSSTHYGTRLTSCADLVRASLWGFSASRHTSSTAMRDMRQVLLQQRQSSGA